MSHIIIEDQESGECSRMCIDRPTQSAIILRADDIEKAHQLFTIAGSLKVGKVYMMVDPSMVNKLHLEYGWKLELISVMSLNVGRKVDSDATQSTLCSLSGLPTPD
jgi:hypothetical protein